MRGDGRHIGLSSSLTTSMRFPIRLLEQERCLSSPSTHVERVAHRGLVEVGCPRAHSVDQCLRIRRALSAMSADEPRSGAGIGQPHQRQSSRRGHHRAVEVIASRGRPRPARRQPGWWRKLPGLGDPLVSPASRTDLFLGEASARARVGHLRRRAVPSGCRASVMRVIRAPVVGWGALATSEPAGRAATCQGPA